MMDIGGDLERLHGELAQAPTTGGGRLVMFLAMHEGEGVSSAASSFAMLAAGRARRPVWLIDLDLRSNTQFNAFAVGPLANRFGGVGRPYSASLGGDPFFSIDPPPRPPAGGAEARLQAADPFTVHRVGETRLMVTQFDPDAVAGGQALSVRSRPRWWEALRRTCEWGVVDAPALSRSTAGLVIAAQVDRVVLVVEADRTSAAQASRLVDAVREHGGRPAGVVLNRTRRDALLFDRMRR